MTAGAGAGAAGFSAATAAVSSGLPAFAANAVCLAANDTGAGGGAALATTARVITASGGLLLGAVAAAPSTLACAGAIGAMATTGVLATVSLLTRTASFATGFDSVNAVVGTAITAPGTC